MQEVWRGRLPRLGVVNSIGRKKFGGWSICAIKDYSIKICIFANLNTKSL